MTNEEIISKFCKDFWELYGCVSVGFGVSVDGKNCIKVVVSNSDVLVSAVKTYQDMPVEYRHSDSLLKPL